MEVQKMPYPDAGQVPIQHRFSPYTDNGGSLVAIGGQGFAIIASDTRLVSGYSILTRDQPKLHTLTKEAVLGASGCWCDVLSLTRLIQARMKLYKHQHQKEMTASALAQMLSTMLYGRRFFPYYVSNVIAGLNEQGNGVVYSYDPVGHCEQETFHAGGSAGALLQPLLDSQIGLKNMSVKPTAPLTMEKAVQIIKDVFTSAAERDINCGDGILIRLITKDGIREETYPLRFD